MALYFDYNASTPIASTVRESLMSSFGIFGNPNSIHKAGREARKLLEEARNIIAQKLGALSGHLIFLSGATEANNLALYSAWKQRPMGTNEVLVSSIEHDSVLKVLMDLKLEGAVVKQIPVSISGQLDFDFVEKNLSAQTALVSSMLANNETGFVLPIKELALKLRQKGVLLHVDAACGVGKLNINFQDLGADYLSFSAHKFYGPKGVGGLCVRKGAPLVPMILGGSQEANQRAGTENLFGIVGMAHAMGFSLDQLDVENSRLLKIRQYLKMGLAQNIAGIRFIESASNQLAGTLSCLIPKVRGETYLAALDLAGVEASLGSACSSGAVDVSRVILALGVPENEAKGVLRLSFGRMTTQDEVDELIRIMGDVFNQMVGVHR